MEANMEKVQLHKAWTNALHSILYDNLNAQSSYALMTRNRATIG